MSKTYGEILREHDDLERHGMSSLDGKSDERTARAVILEFVKRVEADGMVWDRSEYRDTENLEWLSHDALGRAFRRLAKELKEAK